MLNLCLLKELRLKNNWSQEIVGNHLGISIPSYCRTEKGIRKLTADELSNLCSLYNVQIDTFFTESLERKII